MHRQSAIARYRASEKASPSVDTTFSCDAFIPYPGSAGALTFGRNLKALGYDWDTAYRLFRESDCDHGRDANAAFVEGYIGSLPALHFVGFKGDEYVRAVRLYGRPDFIHRKNDLRFACGGEYVPGDTVVYANGSERATHLYSVDDSAVIHGDTTQ